MAKGTSRQTVTLRSLLQDPNKLRDQAENVLAALFRDIMAEHGVEPAEWESRVERYFQRTYITPEGIDVQKVNQAKSNLQRALALPALTWGRFETALQIMGSKSYYVEVGLQYESGNTFTHRKRVRNRIDNVTQGPPARIAAQELVENWKNEDEIDRNMPGYQAGLLDDLEEEDEEQE